MPETLEELKYFSGLHDFDVFPPNIPQRLKKLHAVVLYKELLESLPESLEELSLYFDESIDVICISKLPSKLKRLYIRNNSGNAISIGPLSDSIQDLSLLGYRTQLPDVLPCNLRLLNVDKIIWSTLSSSLRELYVKGRCKIHSLPAGLKKLDALGSTLVHWKLPDSLEFLALRKIKCRLPNKLRHLSLMVHHGLLELPEKLETLEIISGGFRIVKFPENLRELAVQGEEEKEIGDLPS